MHTPTVTLVQILASGGPYPAAQPQPVVFSTAETDSLAFDVTVTGFTGGTSPTIQFFIDRLGVDGNWYNVMQSQTFSAAGSNSADIGPAYNSAFSPPNGVQHAVLTHQARLRYATVGAPTGVNFSASIVGR